MTEAEVDYYYHYCKVLNSLPIPTNARQKDLFCHDISTAQALVHSLKEASELPPLVLFETIVRLEFIIAKNNHQDLIKSYADATKNIQDYTDSLSNQHPELPRQLAARKNHQLNLVEQIAQSVYIPEAGQSKAVARFRYIKQSAEALLNAQSQSLDTQRRFHQIYSTYTTRPTKS